MICSEAQNSAAKGFMKIKKLFEQLIIIICYWPVIFLLSLISHLFLLIFSLTSIFHSECPPLILQLEQFYEYSVCTYILCCI